MLKFSRTPWYLFASILGVLIVAVIVGVMLKNAPTAPITPPSIEEPVSEEPYETIAVIGTSVLGRTIEAYTFGNGDTHLLFVGGVHGGYEWNSVLLAYEMIDHFAEHPSLIPDELSVTIIPSLNPDGVFVVTGNEGRFTATDVITKYDPASARFNAHEVDLNRNFDCKWQPESTWRGNTVSAGSAAFSEPEARALRDWVLKEKPVATVFWHSIAGNVYGSECEAGILPETRELMNTYARAGNYGAVPAFDAYPITGDAEGWLASIGIPAITVELETRDSIEWKRNLAGVTAIMEAITTTEEYPKS